MIQLQFLNFLLKTKDSSLLLMNNISDEFFPEYEQEYKYVKEHLEKYNQIPDQLTFLDKFPKFDIIEVTENSDYLVDKLYEERNTRQLAEVFNKVRTKLIEGDIEDAMSIYTSSVDTVLQAKHVDSIDLLRDISRYDDYVDKITNYDKHFIQTGFKELDEILGGWDIHEELATIVARSNKGKCSARGTEILMADGTIKKVEDIRIGDKVQSYNRINTVLALHDGESNGYKITTSDGDSFVVSSNHILTCWKRNEVWNKQKRCMTSDGSGKLLDIMIEDYLKLSTHQQNLYLLFRPDVEYSKQELTIDPYILGVWLGDGTAREPQITTPEPEIVGALKQYCFENEFTLNMLKSREKNKAKLYSITKGFGKLLKIENLQSNKHIPHNYLISSREQRLELLAGLLDTDGYYAKDNNSYEFTQKSRSLFLQIVQLCRSLGFHVCETKPKIVKGCEYYRFHMYGKLTQIPTRVKRKQATRDGTKSSQRVGFKIEPIDYVRYYGFRCDGDERYMLSNFILTHNTWILLKSSTKAVEQDLRVGIYSGEMSPNKVGYRFDTLLSHLSNSAMVRGKQDIQNAYRKYLEELQTKYKGCYKVLTPNTIDGPVGVNALRAFVEKEKLDILFVDQHSLLEDDRKARNAVERASNISKDLKKLQVTLGIPIITVSQQNRGNTEDGIGLHNIAQSDRIGQDSTVVLFFDQKDGIMEMSLVKSRDSANNKSLNYAIDFDKGIFEYIPESDNAIDGKGTEELAKEFNEENVF